MCTDYYSRTLIGEQLFIRLREEWYLSFKHLVCLDWDIIVVFFYTTARNVFGSEIRLYVWLQTCLHYSESEFWITHTVKCLCKVHENRDITIEQDSTR